MTTRSLIVFITLFTLTVSSMAQPVFHNDLQALQTQLKASRPDTVRAQLLVDLGRYFNSISGDKPALNDTAFQYFLKAEKLSNTLNYAAGLGRSYQLAGRIYSVNHNFAKCDAYTKQALDLFLTNHLWRDAAETYLNMEEFYVVSGGQDLKVRAGYYDQGLLLFLKVNAKQRAAATAQTLGDFYQLLGDSQKALDDLKLALSLFQAVKYQNIQGLYDLLGYVYCQRSDFNNGLKYAQMAVKTAEALGDTSSMTLCTIYNRIALVYTATFQYAQANYYFKKSIHIADSHNDYSAVFISASFASNLLTENKPAEALALLTENDKKHPDVHPEERVELDYLYLVAFSMLKRTSEAQQYALRLLNVYNLPDQGGPLKGLILNGLTRYYVAAKQYGQARKYLPEFIKIAKKNTKNKKPLVFAYQRAYMVDSAEHKYDDAFKNYQVYARLKDSLTESTSNKQLQELEVSFATAKKEKENAFLKSESLAQVNELKHANYVRNLTLAGIVVLLILISSLYYSYRANKRNALAISEKNLALNQLVIEKEWLLKEIHHRVKNNLQIVMGLLQRQSAYIDNDEALAAIQNSENRMRAIALIHQKLYQSESLDLIFMPEYIEEMISYLKDSSGLDNRILFEKHVDEIYLDVAQAVPLGLILNEAVTNAIKYAYPNDENGMIHVSLLAKDEVNNILIVSDDGRGLPEGFDMKKVDSLGLNLMKGLSKQLGGVFQIESNQGCTIHVDFKTEVFNNKH